MTLISPDSSRISQDAANETQSPKPLSVNRLSGSPAQAVVLAMTESGNGARQAALQALAFAVKNRSTTGELDGAFDEGVYIPSDGQANALLFTRTLLHAPTFASTRGNGHAFVERLAAALGDDGVGTVADRLGCEAEDLVLAGDKVRTLLGETLLTAAASAMQDVCIPQHIHVRIRYYRNVIGVVRLVAALAEGSGDCCAFVSQDDAAQTLGSSSGAVSRAFAIAVKLGAIELVKRGERKHRNAPGVASVYRVPWVART